MIAGHSTRRRSAAVNYSVVDETRPLGETTRAAVGTTEKVADRLRRDQWDGNGMSNTHQDFVYGDGATQPLIFSLRMRNQDLTRDRVTVGGVQWVVGFAYLASARGLVVLCAVVGAGVLGAVAVFRCRYRSVFIVWRRWAAACSTWPFLSHVGWSDQAFEAEQNGDLTVLTWSTEGGAPRPTRSSSWLLTTLLTWSHCRRRGFDVASVVADWMAAAGSPMRLYSDVFNDVAARQTSGSASQLGRGAGGDGP